MTFDSNDSPLTTRGAAEDLIPSYSDSGGSSDADKRIERWIMEGSDTLRSMTGREFHWTTGYVERVAARGEKEIWVTDHVPVDTINSITYDSGNSTSTIDADSYEHIADSKRRDVGTIRRITGMWTSTAQVQDGIVQNLQPGTEERLYKVDYDGGWVTQKQDDDDASLTRDLPHDLEGAVLDYVKMQEARHGQDPAVEKWSAESVSVTYRGQEVPQRMASVADFYTLPH